MKFFNRFDHALQRRSARSLLRASRGLLRGRSADCRIDFRLGFEQQTTPISGSATTRGDAPTMCVATYVDVKFYRMVNFAERTMSTR